MLTNTDEKNNCSFALHTNVKCMSIIIVATHTKFRVDLHSLRRRTPGLLFLVAVVAP